MSSLDLFQQLYILILVSVSEAKKYVVVLGSKQLLLKDPNDFLYPSQMYLLTFDGDVVPNQIILLN